MNKTISIIFFMIVMVTTIAQAFDDYPLIINRRTNVTINITSGHAHDQDLNTTDNPTFDGLTLTDNLEMGTNGIIQNPSVTYPNFLGLSYIRGMKVRALNGSGQLANEYFTMGADAQGNGLLYLEANQSSPYAGRIVRMYFNLSDESIHVENPIITNNIQVEDPSYPEIEVIKILPDNGGTIIFNGGTDNNTNLTNNTLNIEIINSKNIENDYKIQSNNLSSEWLYIGHNAYIDDNLEVDNIRSSNLGNIFISGNLVPKTDKNYDLGGTYFGGSFRWRNVEFKGEIQNGTKTYDWDDFARWNSTTGGGFVDGDNITVTNINVTGLLNSTGITNNGSYVQFTNGYGVPHKVKENGSLNMVVVYGGCYYEDDPQWAWICEPPINSVGVEGHTAVSGKANLVVLKTGTPTNIYNFSVNGMANLAGGTNDVGHTSINGSGNVIWGTGKNEVEKGAKGNIIIGNQNTAYRASVGSGAFGQLHDINGTYCYAFGAQNTCNAAYGIALGYNNWVYGGTGVALGRLNYVGSSATFSVTVGYGNNATAQRSQAIGQYVKETETDYLSLGVGSNGKYNRDIRIGKTNITINKTTYFTPTTTSLVNNPYLSAYQDNASLTTITISSANTYYNITHWNVGLFKNMTQTSNVSWTPDYSGIYEVDYSISFTGTATNDYDFVIGINSVMQHSTHAHRKIGTGADIGNVGGTGLIRVNKGDVITLLVEDETAGNDINIRSANIKFVRVGT